MQALRWVEAASGVLASVVGGALFMRLPVGSSHTMYSASCSGASQGGAPCVVFTAESITPTLVQARDSTTVMLLSIIAVLLVAIASAAVWHSLTGRRTARRVLWGCAGAFALLAVWAFASMGIFLAPSVALALVASLCALTVHGPATV